jgi:peptide/nickel transport system permease protein
MSSALETPEAPAAAGGPTPEDLLAEEAESRGEGAWEIAWRQFKKRRLAVLALVVVALLFVVATFAPLLASDLPLYVHARLPAKYENAFWAYDDGQRVLATLLASPAPGDAKLAAEREERIAKLSGQTLDRLEDASYLLGGADAKKMRAALESYRGQLREARAEGGGLDAATWAALREGLEPLSPDSEPAPEVVARPFWPALRALDRTEVFFLALFFTVPLAPVFSRLLNAWGRRRNADPFRLAFGKAAFVFALPTAVAVLLPLAVPRKDDPDRQAYKGLAAAARRASDAGAVFVFTPIPYGENENILEDKSVKPTWLLTREERIARVVPELVRERDARREAEAAAKLPDAVAERTRLIQELDRARSELMKRTIFVRAARTLFPEEPVARAQARKAELDAQIAAATAGQATDLDARIEQEYEARKGGLRWHWLGTDTNGRDVLARMVYGARVSMSVGFVAEGIAVAIGVLLGALAGYFRGWVDIALSRVIEVVICFPTFFFILTILAFLPQSIFNIMVVIGITGWPGIARLMRAEFLRLSNLDFVTAGRALGLSDTRIIFRHILPNGLAPVLVSTTFGIAGAILVESALSFLGFGVPQPTASWGDTLHDGGSDPQATWWLTIFPGTAIFVTVTAYNLVGDAIRDATDPKLRQ